MIIKGDLCWNAVSRRWEVCKRPLQTRGVTPPPVGTGTTPQCCIKPACCIVCKDLNRFLACIANIPYIPGLVAPSPDTPNEQTLRAYLEFITCAYGINRANLNFSIPDYGTLPITYSDVPCYAAPVSLTNVGVNCYNIWVRQCLILTATQIECPTIGVCFETTALDVIGSPGDYYHKFQNVKLCLNPTDYSNGLNCDNCNQQAPTP